MMTSGPLWRVVRQNLRRNLRHFLFSAFGIVIGISTFVFFLGLMGGVSKVVLGDMFPIEQVEVISPKTSFMGVNLPLTDKLVGQVRERPEVAQAYPKMKMGFPAKGFGTLKMGGKRYPIYFEVGGFCDGIDPVLVDSEPGLQRFRDWEELEKDKLLDCGLPPEKQCAQHYYCGNDDKCHHLVPVLISRTILEIYNGSFAPAHGLPGIGTAQELLLRNQMRSMKFTIGLGSTYVKGSTDNLKAVPREVGAQLVGISRRAMPIGMTVPIGYIKRWNVEYTGPEAATRYSSILVEVTDKNQVAPFVSWVKKAGYETEESYAERFAMVILIIRLVFLAISFIIVGLSAANIAHTFFMLISERRKEIGIMRAVGASRADVNKIILAEAAVIGLFGGSVGVAIGLGAAKLCDLVSALVIPDFPFKPDTYFQFPASLLFGALAFAVGFCLIGAFLPARRASQMEPAIALTS